MKTKLKVKLVLKKYQKLGEMKGQASAKKYQKVK